MDEGFKCPAEAGGGYYGSRATGKGGEGESKRAEEEEDEEEDEDGKGKGRGAGVLPYRLRVGWRRLRCSVAGSVCFDTRYRMPLLDVHRCSVFFYLTHLKTLAADSQNSSPTFRTASQGVVGWRRLRCSVAGSSVC